MKEFLKTIIAILMIANLLSSCNDSIDLKNQRALFEVHYVNHAWGYTNNGFLIDSAGYVYTYNLKQTERVKDSSVISNDEMNYKFSISYKTGLKIPTDTLLFYLNKIHKASLGKLTQSETMMADAGIRRCYAYTYNDRKKSYHQILLDQWGDIQISNNSDEAVKIARWLQRLLYTNTLK